MIARRTAFRFCASGLILFPAFVGAAVCPATAELQEHRIIYCIVPSQGDLLNTPEFDRVQSGTSGVGFASLSRSITQDFTASKIGGAWATILAHLTTSLSTKFK